MDSRKFELEADLAEIDRLLSVSTRDAIKELLVTQRLKLANEIKLIPISESSVQIPSENTIWNSLDFFYHVVPLYVSHEIENHDANQISFIVK